MRAKNIMTTRLITIGPEATVHDIAVLLAEKGIRAVPVVDHGEVVGTVSEGDLLHRREIDTDVYRRRKSWLKILESKTAKEAWLKERGMFARDIMTHDVITVTEDTSLRDIANVMENNNVKQLLVMREAKLVGIVTRANLVRALAARANGASRPSSSDDDQIRLKVIEVLEGIPDASPWLTTVIVMDGEVDLYGTIEKEEFRDPSRIEVENIENVVEVRDHRCILQPY